jgi:hypothetical protein
MSISKDPSLLTWDDAVLKVPRSALLVGNGASIAVWDKFSYDSLYLLASTTQKPPLPKALTNDDKALFEAMKTKNFEQVMGALSTGKIVSKALGLPTAQIEERYESIRSALIEAVRWTHIPWEKATPTTLSKIRKELSQYSCVFTLSYDLLIYWAIMSENGDGFKDCFWADLFDAMNTDIWGRPTVVYYLHGGLHLARSANGQTLKRKYESGGNLLSTFGQPIAGYPDALPLFVSEGTASEKMKSIYNSDYLSFAFAQLMTYRGPLCIFGVSLDESDAHLLKAIQKFSSRDIAVALRPKGDDHIVSDKARFRKHFPKAELYFFDSTTHPLGGSY